MHLDAATVLLQWSAGGLFFLWFTTRRREVGLGYGWLLRGTYLLLPTGMLSVWSGRVDDGWHGQLGWFWGACAITTIVLVLVTRAALKERSYSAVMAATGLLYLAILMAFGTDLVARALLAG